MASIAEKKTAPSKIDDPEGPEMTSEEIVEEVKAGRMEWSEFKSFLVHKNHRLFLILFLFAIAATLFTFMFVALRIFKHFLNDRNTGVNDPLTGRSFRNIMESVPFAIAGLWASTYLAYVSELLKEQINKMREMNKKLKDSVQRLKTSIHDLTITQKGMHENVQKFETLQGQLRKQGDQENADFGKIMDESAGVLQRLKEANRMSVGTLLKNIAHKCEDLDDEEGLSKEEYEVWKKHVEAPVELPTFETITKSKVASFEEIDDAIDKMVETL